MTTRNFAQFSSLSFSFNSPIQGNDDKENNSSPFETNGMKKDEVNSSNGTNGIDDDKGFK
jgi:hypothetical protein